MILMKSHLFKTIHFRCDERTDPRDTLQNIHQRTLRSHDTFVVSSDEAPLNKRFPLAKAPSSIILQPPVLSVDIL